MSIRGSPELSTGTNDAEKLDGDVKTSSDVDEKDRPSTVNERALLRKIDLRLMPPVSVLYLLAFLDRVNISNAALFNLKPDLHLVGNQFNTALVIFFVPYVLFEIPSNVLMKRFTPHVWLSACMFMFGLVVVLQGLTQNFSEIMAARFFLGLFETGMFPGCFYLISMWYKRSEAQKRFTFFFMSTSLAGAFGGLLASAIGKMDGVRGYHGWRWVFILEGVLTCTVSALCYFYIPDFPEDATWLTPEEKTYVKNKLQKDSGESGRHEVITLERVLAVLKDYKVILGGLMYFSLIVSAYSFAYFSPTIIKGFGHGNIQTQLLSVPPYAAALVFGMIIASLSDYLQRRFLFIILSLCLSFTGFVILLLEHNNTKLEYAALFLAAMGTYTAMPLVICWFSMNVQGHVNRAVASGWQIGFGNIAGIIASYAFVAKEAPRYPTGYRLNVAFQCFAALSSCLYFIGVNFENRKLDHGEITETEETNDSTVRFRYLT